ncbi:hypothetical protein SAMN05216251_102143 [Actinacidiphila alni]|uniref:Uncharacterized protein n=1 Tax=Actinacidiphila alni TaxID=380248 RepID=A0A1I1YUZ0_9ACTN|nr:hypothetical protein SAMN05216251_102143 [Actinacidiphila alni]
MSGGDAGEGRGRGTAVPAPAAPTRGPFRGGPKRPGTAYQGSVPSAVK